MLNWPSFIHIKSIISCSGREAFEKTKIICTIRTASEEVTVLTRLIEKGMNVARINFSHGRHEEHQKRIDNIREAASITGTPLAIMLDTRGPEIRTGTLAQGNMLQVGQEFILTNR